MPFLYAFLFFSHANAPVKQSESNKTPISFSSKYIDQSFYIDASPPCLCVVPFSNRYTSPQSLIVFRIWLPCRNAQTIWVSIFNKVDIDLLKDFRYCIIFSTPGERSIGREVSPSHILCPQSVSLRVLLLWVCLLLHVNCAPARPGALPFKIILGRGWQ